MDRFNAVSARFAEELSDDEMNEVIAEQAGFRKRSMPSTAGTSSARPRSRWTRSAFRQAIRRHKLSGGEKRRVALQAASERAGHASSRRADNHLDAESVAWLRASFTISGNRRHDHARPLFPRRGGGLDPRTRPRRRHPLRGQLFRLAGAEAEAAGAGGQAGRPRKALSRARLRAAPKAARLSKARINAYEKMLADEGQRQIDTAKIHIPAGPRLGDIVINAEGLSKDSARLLIDDLSFRLPPGGSSASSAERRRQDDAVPDDHRRRIPRQRHLHRRRYGQARLCRPVA